MIQDAHAGKFQLILTKEVSRFSRNIVDTLSYTRELKRIGVAVEFVTDHINTMETDGELRLSIMATIAQDESRKTSSRVVWGQTRQMERGVVFGRSMLGYDVQGGKLTIEPKGANIVRLIFQKYAVEQVGTTKIARWLTREGYRTCRGSRQWTPAALIKILKNEKYVGDLVQKKTYTADYLSHEKRTNRGNVPLIRLENHHEPIVSRDIWNLTQERLQKNNKHSSSYNGHSNRYVFSGKIKCGQCGASFVGRVRSRKDGTKVRRWRCAFAAQEGAGKCSIGKLIRDDDAMHMLKTAVRSLLIDSETIIRNVTSLALDAIQAGEKGTKDTQEQLQYEIEKIKQKKFSVIDLYLSGEIAKEDMLDMKQQYDQHEQAIRDRLKEAKSRSDIIADTKEAICITITSLLHGQAENDAFCKNILDHLTVYPDRHMELTLRNLPMVFHFRYTEK